MNSEVVIYTRPWFAEYYSILASALSSGLGCRVSFISDYSVPGSYDLRNVASLNYVTGIHTNALLEIQPYVQDIIKRDRFLRTLSDKQAEQRILAYYCSIVEFFSQRKVLCIISATVDQYVVDLIYLYSLLKCVPFIGYHISVIPNYTLFTSRGEIYRYRAVEQEEIDSVIKLISHNAFRPAYIPKPKSLGTVGFKRYGVNVVRYLYYRFISIFPANKLNYHVEASLIGSRDRLSFGIIRALIWRCDEMPSGRYLYLPLQFHPECNSEYWSRDSTYEDYEDKIIRFAKANANLWRIVIKEHPNMLGFRSSEFYSRIKRYGCQVVSPCADHKTLLKESYAVVTLNSSAGIEAVCERKVVICLSDPYYRSNYHLVKDPSEPIKAEEIESILASYDACTTLREIVRKILESSAPVSLPDIRYRSAKDVRGYGLESAKIFTRQIKDLILKVGNSDRDAGKFYTIN